MVPNSAIALKYCHGDSHCLQISSRTSIVWLNIDGMHDRLLLWWLNIWSWFVTQQGVKLKWENSLIGKTAARSWHCSSWTHSKQGQLLTRMLNRDYRLLDQHYSVRISWLQPSNFSNKHLVKSRPSLQFTKVPARMTVISHCLTHTHSRKTEQGHQF